MHFGMWHPIHPIDRTPVGQRMLLYIPSFPAPANRTMVGIRYPGQGFWHVEHPSLNTVGGKSPHQPTDWMPLPEPPGIHPDPA